MLTKEEHKQLDEFLKRLDHQLFEDIKLFNMLKDTGSNDEEIKSELSTIALQIGMEAGILIHYIELLEADNA